MIGLTVQNFVTPAVGLAVLVALIRGLTRKDTDRIGNFWVDMTRSVIYILLPLSILWATVLVWQGVPQNLNDYTGVSGPQGFTQLIAQGPAASQVAIKQLGTNGGGFFNINSAHPFENPTPLANFAEVLAILLIPAACVFLFGKMVKDTRQGLAILGTMLVLFGGGLVLTVRSESTASAAIQRSGILDLGLPGMDGVEVINGLRGWSEVPIIVLSAREQEADKVLALDAGADDYVTKPFGMDELLARLRAAVRRGAGTKEEEPVIETNCFSIDLGSKKVKVAGQDVRLTPTEWHLVELLVRNPGKLLSQGYLLKEVWGPQYSAESDYLRVYMAQIRRKLEPDAAHPRFFITEPGMGYRFEPDTL